MYITHFIGYFGLFEYARTHQIQWQYNNMPVVTLW